MSLHRWSYGIKNQVLLADTEQPRAVGHEEKDVKQNPGFGLLLQSKEQLTGVKDYKFWRREKLLFRTSSEKKENQVKLSPRLNLTGRFPPSADTKLPTSTTKPNLLVITYTINRLSLVHLQNPNKIPSFYIFFILYSEIKICVTKSQLVGGGGHYCKVTSSAV